MNLLQAVENGRDKGYKVVFNASFINSNDNNMQNVKVKYYQGKEKKEEVCFHETLENVIKEQQYLIEKNHKS